jgi:hypothetical protein
LQLKSWLKVLVDRRHELRHRLWQGNPDLRLRQLRKRLQRHRDVVAHLQGNGGRGRDGRAARQGGGNDRDRAYG